MTDLNIGGHMSLGRKPDVTVQQAADEGFQSMQIFASSPGAWRPPVADELATARFRRAREEYGVSPLFIHAIYLINLASDNPELVRRSISSLKSTLQAGAEMGAAGVITHIGSHAGRGFEAVAGQVADALGDVIAAMPADIFLALENSAGAGGIIGAELSQLAELVGRAGNDPRLLVALDTAHLVGSGWDFTVPDTPNRLVEAIEGSFGLERLAVIHANDSAVPVGSHKDRHANIGEGYIGMEGFRNLLAAPLLRQVPWIMETPDLGDREPGQPVGSLVRLRELAAAGPCAGVSRA